MLRTLKSKRKRTSTIKIPANPDSLPHDAARSQLSSGSQRDLFNEDRSRPIDLDSDGNLSFQDDIDALDWDRIEEQLKDKENAVIPPTPGFSDKDTKMKYKSPLAKTPCHSQTSKLARVKRSPARTPPNVPNLKPRDKTPEPTHRPRQDKTPVRPASSTRAKNLEQDSPMLFSSAQNSSRSSSNIPPVEAPSFNISNFNSSIFLTPMKGGGQRQLYSTGLMSPYTAKCGETVRLGVPEEVFRLIDKIRGIKQLYPWQEATVRACLTGGNHIFTCPTSGGKTLVGELLLLNAVLTRSTDALLVLPYVALVEEKVRELAEFAEHFSFGLERYAGSRGRFPPRKKRQKKTVYVATIEKANSLFNSLYEEGRCNELGVVIVDELHMIGDGYRGAILETCLAKLLSLQPGPRIIGMTATLNNHKEIAGFLKCSMEHVGAARPVALHEHVKIGDTIYKVDKKEGLSPARKVGSLTSPSNTSKLQDTDCVATLVQECIPECVLVFCPTKNSCETTARMLANVLTCIADEKTKERRKILQTRIESETGHLDSVLAEILPMGISYHHSGLTGDERTLIEEAFSTGVLLALCCTSTLAAGVNLPASRVIIRSIKIGTSQLSRTRYLQMVGRAGRTGLSSSGDSFLLGNTSDKKILQELVFGQIEDVRSCLDKQSLTLTLLHLIGSGMIQSVADLGTFMKRTLLHLQQPDACLTIAETALKYLQDSKFVEKKEGKILPTSFGNAVYKSSLDPTLSHMVMDSIREANTHLVLRGDLHLTYLCVPPLIENVYVNWMLYFDSYNKFDETTKLTFLAAGLEEAYLARRAFSQNAADVAKEVPYKKFYVAGAIHMLISGAPTWRVSNIFKIPRGTLQSNLNACIAHASKLAYFTKELPEYWALSSVFEALVKKLFFAGTPELAQILELPGIKAARAKQLHRAGYQSLQKLAAAEPRLMVGDIEHLTEHQAQKIISSAKIMLQEQADALTDAAIQLLEEV